MSNRTKLTQEVFRILGSLEPPRGGIAAWVKAVKENDGILATYKDGLLDEALTSIVGRYIRTIRDDVYQSRLFHSVELVVGQDDEGNPIRERDYLPAAEVYQSPDLTDQVVGYYERQGRAYHIEANRTVRAARAANPLYKRPIPHPELDDEDMAAG